MDRRECMTLLASAPLVFAARGTRAGASSNPHHNRIVIDGQGSIADPYSPDGVTRASKRAIDELRASGLTACSMTVNDVGNDPKAFEGTIQEIAKLDQYISDNQDIYIKAGSAADILRAKREAKLAIIYNTQDTSLIGADLDRIGLLKGLGVRIVELTYNNRNLSGDGCLEPGNGGVSRLGMATIERIEHEGLLLDLSHSGQRTVAEALSAAQRPPTISHTGCRALCDNPRNQWDAELRAVADKGGVVGIYWMPFLVPNGRPTGADLLRHIEHAVKLCGEDHVAIGTDGIIYKTVIDAARREQQRKFFERRRQRGIAAPGEGPDIFNIVEEWDTHLRFHFLADGMARLGWKEPRISKILGGNLLRLYWDIWGG
jgi:membrane dipeptidase